MAQWSEGLGSMKNYLSTKVGNEVILTIEAINRVTDSPDFEPKNKDGKSQGFVFEFVGKEGTVTASTYALQTALKDADVDVGDTIRITHPGQAQYIVEKLEVKE
jgi:hypothetical protein